MKTMTRKMYVCDVTGNYAFDADPEAYYGTGKCSECNMSMEDDHDLL